MSIAAAVLALGLGGIGSEIGAQVTDADAKAKLEASRRALEQRKQAEKEISGDIVQMRIEREQLNRDLVEMARQIQRSESQLNVIEARLGELEAQEKLLKGSLAQRHDQVARLLAAMQRMGRNPPPVLITRREDALKMVRSAAMLARLYPELSEQALSLARQLSELARIMDESKSQSEKLKAETARINENRTRLSMLMETKKQSMAERQSELDKIRREAAEMSRNVTDLNELIGRLDRAVAAHTGQDIAPKAPPLPAAATPEATVAAAPFEPTPATPPAATTVAAASPSAPPLPAAPAGPSEQPALRGPAIAAVTPPPARPELVAPLRPGEKVPPDKPGAAFEIAPKGQQTASLNPGRLAPAIPFAQMKGKLQLPAQGRRVLAFGEKTQHGERARGMVLETRASGQVIAPADSWVVFAGEFRSFGQLLIMNAGDGYHILLAGLSQIDVQLGEFVLAGQPVGVMSGPSKGGKAKADQAPVLYIEFRKDSRPIDPDPWWVADGLIKVQG